MSKNIITQSDIFNLIEQETGNKNLITVPRTIIDFTGSINTGILLAQLLYWTDKAKNFDKWIFKTNQEWFDETGLTSKQIIKAREQLMDLGVLDYTVKKANATPTGHYRIRQDRFLDKFTQYLQAFNSDLSFSENRERTIQFSQKDNLDQPKGQSNLAKRDESITDITTDTTTDNTTEVINDFDKSDNLLTQDDNPLEKDTVNQSLESFVDNTTPLDNFDNSAGNPSLEQSVKKDAAPKTAPVQAQDPGHDLQNMLTPDQHKKLLIISKLMHGEHIKINAMWMDIISTHGLDILVAMIDQINLNGKTHISNAYIDKTVSSVQKIKAKEERKEERKEAQAQEGQVCTSTGQKVEVDIVPRVHCKVPDRDYVGKYHMYNYDYQCTCGAVVDPWKKQCPQCEAFFNWKWTYKDMRNENYDYSNFSEKNVKNEESALKEAV